MTIIRRVLGLAAAAAAGASAVLPGAASAAGSETPVVISNFTFSPNPLSLRTGETVTWTNRDDAPHTVTTSSGPAKLDSPELAKGQSWTFTFSQAGVYAYYCAVHPGMRAKVVVTAAVAVAAPAVSAPPTPAPGGQAAGHASSNPAPTAPANPAGAVAAGRLLSPPSALAPADAAIAATPGDAVVTTTTKTSPGGLQVNPLLFLLAVVVGVVVACTLAFATGRGRAPTQAAG